LVREKREAEKFAKKVVKIPKPPKNSAYKKSGGPYKSGGGPGGGRWVKDKMGRRHWKIM